jgi:Flp pilus assembly CpaE family ATPase
VTTADLIGLWNARSCLRYLAASPGIPSEAVSVVINRHAGREHHSAAEVERALGVPVLAVIPEDARAARKARRDQQPFASGGGAAARELRALAKKATELSPTATEEVVTDDRARWRWRRQPVEGRR